MKEQILTVAVMGLGNRGQTFAALLDGYQNVRVTAVAEPRDFQRDAVGDKLGIPENRRFHDWREIADLPERIAEAVIITLQDALHGEAACAFAKRGYQIFLEKPMSPTWTECKEIAVAAEKNHVSLTICHELRYTRYFQALKKLLDEGAIGRVQTLTHFESVVYWHQTHSYVRGNWRNEKLSSSMLLAKSCHDMDIISFLLNRKCEKISSFGSLGYFRKECAPAGAAARCTACPREVESRCPYSAVKIYRRDRAGKGNFDWPVNIITDQLTLAGVDEALRKGPYGRCVFACDNDVVDHQTVNMLFEGGVTAVFTMTAFTRIGGLRETRICGTEGEIVGDGETLTVFRFLDDSRHIIQTAKDSSGNINDGHGGGDFKILDAWLKSLRGEASTIISGPEATLESHRMTFAAEESRRSGKTVELR